MSEMSTIRCAFFSLQQQQQQPNDQMPYIFLHLTPFHLFFLFSSILSCPVLCCVVYLSPSENTFLLVFFFSFFSFISYIMIVFGSKCFSFLINATLRHAHVHMRCFKNKFKLPDHRTPDTLWHMLQPNNERVMIEDAGPGGVEQVCVYECV